MSGEPLAVAERDELVLAAVHHHDRDRDVVQLESPGTGLRDAVLPPAFAPRREPFVRREHQVIGQLAGQDRGIGGRQEGLHDLSHVIG